MRRILLGIAFIGMTLGFAACDNDGISQEELNESNATLIAAVMAPQNTDVSDPKVKEIVTKWTDRELTTSQAKSQLKALGFTDAQVDAALKDDDNTPTATQTRATAKTPAATQTPPASTPTGSGSTGSATEARVLTSKGSIPALPNDKSRGAWTIKVNDTALDPSQDGAVGKWLAVLENPNPSQWETAANVRNPIRTDFPTADCRQQANARGVMEEYCQVPQGVEYGEDESPFCENHPCDLQLSPWHFRLITGDYSFLGHTCQGNADAQKGCLLLIINVMDRSVTFRDQDVDNGYTLTGRYWDGDNLQWGTLGLVSHHSAAMLGMKTYAHPGEPLNAGNAERPDNAGANCGTPNACRSVDAFVVIVSGDRVLATAQTTVTSASK